MEWATRCWEGVRIRVDAKLTLSSSAHAHEGKDVVRTLYVARRSGACVGTERACKGVCAMQAGETKKCRICNHVLDIERFDLKPGKPDRYSCCQDCFPVYLEANARNNERRRSKYVANRQKRLDHTAVFIHCHVCGLCPRSSFECNKMTGLPLTHCIKCNRDMIDSHIEYNKTSVGKATHRRFLDSEKGKECLKRARESDAAKATRKRHRKNKAKHYSKCPALRLNGRMVSKSNELIAGRQKTSKSFIELSGFASESEFLDAVKRGVQSKGMSYDMHGSGWQLDHRIPREAYDFNDPEDVRRCWSPKNVHVLSSADNHAKSWKLLDHYLMEAGAENFPVAWNGKLPDEEFKAKFHASCTAKKYTEEPSTSASSGPSTLRMFEGDDTDDDDMYEEEQPPPDSDSD